MNNGTMFFAALLLVAINGFFVAAEFALVRLRQTQIKSLSEEHGIRGRVLARIHGNLDAYLSACQVGITLASLALGWIGEPAFAALLTPLLLWLGIDSQWWIHAISIAFAFTVISYLHIVIGEQAPKSWAIRRPEPVSLWTALPLFGFYYLMYPFIWGLNASATWVLAKLGLAAADGHGAQYSPDELKLILRDSRDEDSFTRDEWRVLAHSLDFSNLEVSDLMRPFHEVAALRRLADLESNLKVVEEHRYSRYPLLEADGSVLGVVHLKSLFFALREGALPADLAAITQPTQLVAPSLPALELFRRFREGAPHFAVVGMQGRPPVGFITLDNLLGALVGEIRDEFRQSHLEWVRLDDGSLRGKGSLPIATLERALGMDIDAGDADSVGGLLMERLGSLPMEGQCVAFDGFDVTVERMQGNRILNLRVVQRYDDEIEEH